MSFATLLSNPATAGAICIAAAFLFGPMLSTAFGKRKTKDAEGPSPAWEWFGISNFIAVLVFSASLSFLFSNWLTDGSRSYSIVLAFSKPPAAAAVVGILGSMLYFIAFFGVSFVHEDVAESLRAEAAAASTSPQGETKDLNPEYDADVVIVGAGTVGAALAAALARDGKKVVLIERELNQVDRIVGELMQPGGIRALESMGLDTCAKGAAIDPVTVEGYVCITPNTDCKEDLVLTYPASDPKSVAEFFGMLGKDTRAVKINASHKSNAATVEEDAALADMSPTAAPIASAAAANPNVCPVTGVDLQPRGRSFHNHRFVHQLRKAALAEKNVSFYVGTARKILTLDELEAPAASFDAGSATKDGLKSMIMNDLRTSFRPAGTFAGYDFEEKSRGSLPAPPAPSTDADLPRKAKGTSKVNTGGDGETVVGVAWLDDAGNERVTTARLTIIADGMYSALRSKVHLNAPKTASHFCGYILHHPAGKTPLPYPNRGHVLMADPSPVLLYQISSTETRVLVDIAGRVPNVADGSLRKYFEEVIAPQMPPVVRPFFLKAVATQEPSIMPNRGLVTAPYQKKGVVLLGDSWNMRHPLTGGGMTVALQDTELFWSAIRHLDLQSVSWQEINRRISLFQEARKNHATTINVLSFALYRVFSKPASDNGTRARLREACLDYLSLGGLYTAGPVGLLAGLTPKPAVLVAHFFAVASFAMKRALLPCPTPGRIRQGYDLLHVACIIIMPLLQNEKATFLSSKAFVALSNILFPWKNTDIATM